MSRIVARRPTDSAALLALACAAIAAFIGQLAFGTQPAFFLPVGICAVPFAASPRRKLLYRLLAALALAVFIAATGLRQGSLFLPSLAALAFSAYRAAPGRTPKGRHRRRR